MIQEPVGELYVLRLLQSSSCFKHVCGRMDTVCAMPPCACAQSLLDEIGKPLQAEINRLRAALDQIAAKGLDAWAVKIAMAALEPKP